MKKRLILAGGTGYLGCTLARFFTQWGWEVVILTRRPARTSAEGVGHVLWDGKTLGEWAETLEGAAALINLAGRTVNCRYTRRNRTLILNSRVDSTRVLGQAIERCSEPPPVWLNASTATIYRHTFGPAWDESGAISGTREVKDEFSVEVAQAWEGALAEAGTPRTRKVALRTAMVLGHGANSVFPVLRRLVRLGLGGRMGSGKQFVSWIHEEDFCRAAAWLIDHPEISGIVNLAAPNPVTNAEMMRLLRKICRVPIGLPAAQWMLETGAFFLRTETELILKSRRVVPGRLLASGFSFSFPDMKETFVNLCAPKP
jgi:uncharacterized protein (TIGR01777 family)